MDRPVCHGHARSRHPAFALVRDNPQCMHRGFSFAAACAPARRLHCPIILLLSLLWVSGGMLCSAMQQLPPCEASAVCPKPIPDFSSPGSKAWLRRQQYSRCLTVQLLCIKLYVCMQECETVVAVCKQGSAPPLTTIGAAATQQHSPAPSEAARTELAGSLSSRSSASRGSDCRWVGSLPLFRLACSLPC